MGVRGLATLVDDNKEELLSDHKLHDTRVIIDGSNLYHFLYYHYNIPVQYGGDYDHYARKCKHFFSMLRRCSVEPYIVFDGGYNPDDRKLPIVLERMESRRLRAGLICLKGRGCVLPILCYETFREVLVEMGIAHVSSMYEADREIAVLAHRWKCPVLSNDSDFFIYGIEGGYIPLDYINMTLCVYNTDTNKASVLEKNKVPSESEFIYIPVRYYHYKTFVKRFRKKYSEFILPMFATLCGNDYVNPALLSTFYPQIHVPKNPSKKAFSLKAQTHMLAILYWLDTMDSEEEALEHLFEHIPKQKLEKVKAAVTQSFNDYRYIEKFTSLEMDLLLDGSGQVEASQDIVPKLLDFNDIPLPPWFVECLRRCKVTGSFLQNITINHRAIFSCQIEILKEPSTYACSRDIRNIIYGIVMNPRSPPSTGETNCQSSSGKKASRQNFVEEFDREIKNLKKIFVEPALTVQTDSQILTLPSLDKVPTVCVEERRALWFSSVGVTTDMIADSHDNVALALIGILGYWVRNANPRITENHLSAVIICVAMLHMRALQRMTKGKQISYKDTVPSNLIPSMTEAIKSLGEEEVDKFVKHMEKHFEKPDKCSRSTRESRVIHGFSQFQTCYLDALYLNQVLQAPLRLPGMAEIMNCTFLYNVCRDLDTRPKPDFYIAEIFSHDTPLHKIIITWKETVIGLCKTDHCNAFEKFTENVKTSSKKKSKVKRQKTTENNEHPSSPECEHSESETASVYCDLNNKFALLGMED